MGSGFHLAESIRTGKQENTNVQVNRLLVIRQHVADKGEDGTSAAAGLDDDLLQARPVQLPAGSYPGFLESVQPIGIS